MSEWKAEYLKGLVDIRISNVDKKIYMNEASVKLCNYMDAYENDYLTSKISYSNGSANSSEIQRFSLKTGDVVITKDSETPDDIAIPSVITEEIEDLICGYHLAILRPNNKINGVFLMFVLQQPDLKNYFARVANGSTRYGLTIGDIEKAKIKYPNLPEQLRIAKILTIVDHIIEKTEQGIAKYKAIKQGMLHDLFTRGIDLTTGKLRPRYEEVPELYKESKLGWVPREWGVDTIENISKRIWIGLVTTMTTHYVENGIPLIRNNNIRDNRIDKNGMIQLDKTFSDNNSQRYLHEGDIVTVHTGDIGTSAIIDKHLDPSHGFATINTKVDAHKINNEFLCYYFNSMHFKNRIEMYATGDGRSNFNLYDFLYILIVFPKNIKEQKLITEGLNSLDKKLHIEQSYLHKLQMLKAGLMVDLLSEKKLVKVEDESLMQSGN